MKSLIAFCALAAVLSAAGAATAQQNYPARPIRMLVPFAPEVYDAARRLPGRTIVDVERELRAMAARTKVQIVGSYDPRAVGMATRDFFDESHPRPDVLARVVGQAVGAP